MQGGRTWDLPEPLCESGVFFPLTPTLSRGERERQSTARAKRTGIRLADRLARIPPLPWGEGWGEGELGAGRFRRRRIAEALAGRSHGLQCPIRKPVF